MADEQTNDVFLNSLRRALQHLYDPGELRRNPLQSLLGIDSSADRVTALRKILQDAIQALKPDEKIPLESNAWRIYDVLSFRFIEQSSQKEVAADLSLSIRQLQRLETTSLQVLGDNLVSRYNLKFEPDILEVNQEPDYVEIHPEREKAEFNSMVEQELNWLRKSYRNEEIESALLVDAALKTIASLVQAMHCVVEIEREANLPKAIGQTTPLSQALINLLTAAVQWAENGQVRVSTKALPGRINIGIEAIPASPDQKMDRRQVDEFISVARQLVELSGGVLEIPSEKNSAEVFAASLVLPAAQHKVVLVIDDNADTLLLMERYLSGSLYQFIGGRDPLQALALAEIHHPNAIVLDVMLPGIDGWNLLGQFKANPMLHQIPVIVSTILPQESLAMMLGADDFLQKPFTQAQFLAVLERQTAQLVTESH
jgi:CheY-like chemotaxis protein